jgi:predicted nuclease of predicted toxin-antitoxin system
MRLLFDENLAPSLCRLLHDVFPDCSHVLSEGLGGRPDEEVVRHAESTGMAIVTKDPDYTDLAITGVNKVKVVRITLGNCTVQATYLLLRNTSELIEEFCRGDDAVLEIP